MVEVVKYGATGRRKTAVARVNIMPGTGIVKVNKRTFEDYFPSETDRIRVLAPLKVTNNLNKFDLVIHATGGGLTGQADAIKLGLSRALSKCDEDTRAVLKKAKYLSRDPRMKERKKPGQKGARKKFQWVKR
ncbi:MAG: 30S ribosomal protein S9 [Candidatus Omnitrophica bacterium]|nr:30S ribosomal protein S9 [Candidatus Omnitrophota bacterium]